LAALVAALTACNTGGTQPGAATSIPVEDEIIVEGIAFQLLESFPVQVNAVLSGALPDACSFVERVEQVREDDTFLLTLTIARQPNQRCALQPTPFEEIVGLDVGGLPAGTYNVEAHGASASFTLDADNE
jgi:inhibitor of cysteine peptidase